MAKAMKRKRTVSSSWGDEGLNVVLPIFGWCGFGSGMLLDDDGDGVEEKSSLARKVH